jgi:hypothetical protein
MRGIALSWIESYLSDRQQCVQITKRSGNVKTTHNSSYLFNRWGIPQGSILGPLLFILYVNDLPHVTDQKCVQFADDTTLIVHGRDINELERLANLNIKLIVTWLESNNLKVNLNKTNYIKFKTTHNADKKIDISCNNNIIGQVNFTKFLGITLDNQLDWKTHIDTLVSKLDRFIFALNRIRQIASKEAALTAYHGYVSSILRYGLILWGNSVDAPRAFKIQKKCVRSICGAHFLDSCRPLFKALNILPLPSLYIYEMAIFVKKYNHLFQKNKDLINYRGRKGEDLQVPRQRLTLYSKSTFCMAIRLYNKLPDVIKTLTFLKFRKELFLFLMTKMYYSINYFLNDKSF